MITYSGSTILEDLPFWLRILRCGLCDRLPNFGGRHCGAVWVVNKVDSSVAGREAGRNTSSVEFGEEKERKEKNVRCSEQK